MTESSVSQRQTGVPALEAQAPELNPLLLKERGTNQAHPGVIEHGFIASLRIIFRYLLAELRKKQRAFKIGFGTILIVVTFLTALESGLESVPLAFFKVAENQAGEADFVMTPTKTTFYNPPNAAVYSLN